MLLGESRVERLVVHRVGNKAREEGIQLSERTTSVDGDVSALILNGYLKGIVSEKKKFQFVHETDLNLNEVYHYSRQFFSGELEFLEASHRIAKHLYAHSLHPNITAGDVFVILFEGLSDGESTQRALGIFKSEIRDDFLTIVESGSVLDIGHATGINPNLIDKGALVLENGPIVYAVDRFGHKAKFWMDDFLKALRVPDGGSRGRMMAEVLEHLSDDIANPLEQVRFKDEFLNLCAEKDEVSAGQVTAMAERYVPKEQVSQALHDMAENYGFALDERSSVPAQNMYKRLERTLSKVSLGHGINLLVPSNYKLDNIHSVNEGPDGLVITLKMSRRD